MGRQAYPQAATLLITADAGGSNGYRCRAWKMNCNSWRMTCVCASRCRTPTRYQQVEQN
jgi:hypothetical protein